MTALAPVNQPDFDLRTLVDRATAILANARSAADVLEARDVAGFAYDMAKRTARLQRAKDAHDVLIGAAHRAQAHALEIEARAKHRLADEYDAAQARGEVVGAHNGAMKRVPDENAIVPATSDQLGLSRKDIHEARQIRDAERADPGIVRRTLDERLARGEEPTRAALRKMVVDAAMRGLRPQRRANRRNPLYVAPTPEQAAWRHVTGIFRAFAEWASDENLALASEGMRQARDTPFHDLDANAIAQGSAAFTTIKEWFDAR
jgi:hypothetical protein